MPSRTGSNFQSLLFAVVALIATTAMAHADCATIIFDEGTVSSVRDGRTLLLADGREVRLIGIETPTSSKASLSHIVDGKSIQLEMLETSSNEKPATDRYGRLPAFVFLPGSPVSVQQRLIAEGAARVSARIGEKSCAESLLASEQVARRAERGLWKDPNFAPLAAKNHQRLTALSGQFALVEGQVLSVRESGATIYVNFGTRWTRDFTVTIPKRQKQSFVAAGLDLDTLTGRRIRVRGTLEKHGGPIMDVTKPWQIELND